MNHPTTPTTRVAASLGALVLGATTLAIGGPSPAAADDADATPARIAGENRYETAADVATFDHERADDVVLAIGSAFADALAAAPLAGLEDAPVLLTEHDNLPQSTIEALQELETSHVWIMGGPLAVSYEVEAELEQNGYDTTRVAGDDRYETAATLARMVQERQGNGANFPGDVRAAFLANGERFPDALSAAPLSANGPSPIPMLLTPQGHLPEATRDAVEDLEIEAVFIVGGPAAVSDHIRAELEEMGVNTDRIAGDDRTATAAEAARFARDYLGFDYDHVVLARGDAFPDALAAGPFAGGHDTPVLLTPNPYEIGPHTEDLLLATCDTVDVVRAVGGENAIRPGTLQQAVDAADGCSDTNRPEQGQSFEVAPMERLTPEPGDTVEFRVMGEDGRRSVTSTVDLTMLPCDETDVLGSGGDTFDDSDDDGHADGIGDSDTSNAWISRVNGSPMPAGTTYVGEVEPMEDGRITFRLTSPADDCATTLVYDDEDDDHAFDLFRDEPAERYGVGQVAWG